MYISRIALDKREQLTAQHLLGTASCASYFAQKINTPEMASVAALFHDMGKFSTAFVQYLRQNDISKRGSVIHSTQGAKRIFELWHSSDALISEMIGNVISGHHGVLMDGISSSGETSLTNRILNTNRELYYEEVKKAFYDADVLPYSLEQKLMTCRQELLSFIQICKREKLNCSFMVHLLTKFLFSCLVDADRYNAYCFEINKAFERTIYIPDWGILAKKLESYLNKFEIKKDIDHIRKNISEKCLKAARRPCGVYKLEVPTGGGKTFSSLRFALNHAHKHGMERIIYVIPYLSVLEQTAKNIREALGIESDDEIVLEHHSNLIPEEDEKKAKETQLLTNRWSAPIIITTLVQFLESLYSEKAGKLRKMHNMAKAVLIFDEVQSLPVKCVHLFNEAINFLSVFGGSTVLLCTATQPLLDKVVHPVKLSDVPELIQNCNDEFEKLKRTRIVPSIISGGYSQSMLCEFILKKVETSGNCLVILNTKSDAAKTFTSLKEYINQNSLSIELVHLSTRMCPAHRLEVINNMKKELGSKHIICVSTQLIEAGVDISFGCVIRALAGLDSIAQAAGRCNRNGENPDGSDVYIVNLAEENLSKLPDIKQGSEVTRNILNESFVNLLSSKAMERYYEEYFYRRKTEMDYFVEESASLYDLLASNKKGLGAYLSSGGETRPALVQAFQTAGEHFCVIQKNTTDVLVPYKYGAELIDKYHRASLKDKSRLLREMSRYSVALYSNEKKQLEYENALYSIDDVLVLDKKYYDDKEMGVVFSAELEFLNL
ncbi:MAG: CRISPR-associated helicase Cas3' [Clostridiaceae bacterium]|nr:CRISPR-associated helicase Cas3' [Clostridiaceae bacterium]